jgi:ABC-2 type transport system permease protein
MEESLPITHRVVELFFGMFFLALTGLMVFSTGLLLYGNLFRSPEAAFLMSTPADADQIFAYKFHEALLLSGWGFLLLGTPLLVSYGVEMSATWQYYLMFVPYLLAFLLLPGAIGGLACLLIVNYFPRRLKQVIVVLLFIGLIVLMWWGFSVAAGAQRDQVSEAWVRKLIDHLKPGTLPFLPSLWMTRGLMAGAGGDWAGALFYLLLLWSNGLFLYLLAAWAARRLYRRAYDRVTSAGGPKRKFGLAWPERLLGGMIQWTDPRTRLFIVKDFRTFRRDPVQWVQVLIFVVLLGFSFMSIPSLPYSQYAVTQRALIGLLNLVVLGLMLATYTSRFVFPMMSMEGNKFWILGLLPLERDRLLWSKFAYAATLTTALSFVLALLSELMLRLPGAIIVLHLLTMVALALGLSGLSVGLGAYLVNLKETNPSKIATGFGGTINLLVSLGFSIGVILLAGAPTILAFQRDLPSETLWRWLPLCGLGILILGLAAVFIPMRMGIAAFRRMEF